MEIKNYFAQDAQGNIMPSANCYLYLPGTTTLATGLVDGNGTPISNPFLASSIGQVTFGAPNGVYDLRIAQGARDTTIEIQCADLLQALNETASFLGAKSSAPTTRNDGSALQIADRYLNTGDQLEYLYKSTGWVVNNLDGQIIATSQGASLIGALMQDGSTGTVQQAINIGDNSLRKDLALAAMGSGIVAHGLTGTKPVRTLGSGVRTIDTAFFGLLADGSDETESFRAVALELQDSGVVLNLSRGVLGITGTVDIKGFTLNMAPGAAVKGMGSNQLAFANGALRCQANGYVFGTVFSSGTMVAEFVSGFANRPVMVFVDGGGFFGSTYSQIYAAVKYSSGEIDAKTWGGVYGALNAELTIDKPYHLKHRWYNAGVAYRDKLPYSFEVVDCRASYVRIPSTLTNPVTLEISGNYATKNGLWVQGDGTYTGGQVELLTHIGEINRAGYYKDASGTTQLGHGAGTCIEVLNAPNFQSTAKTRFPQGYNVAIASGSHGAQIGGLHIGNGGDPVIVVVNSNNCSVTGELRNGTVGVSVGEDGGAANNTKISAVIRDMIAAPILFDTGNGLEVSSCTFSGAPSYAPYVGGWVGPGKIRPGVVVRTENANDVTMSNNAFNGWFTHDIIDRSSTPGRLRVTRTGPPYAAPILERNDIYMNKFSRQSIGCRFIRMANDSDTSGHAGVGEMSVPGTGPSFLSIALAPSMRDMTDFSTIGSTLSDIRSKYAVVVYMKYVAGAVGKRIAFSLQGDGGTVHSPVIFYGTFQEGNGIGSVLHPLIDGEWIPLTIPLNSMIYSGADPASLTHFLVYKMDSPTTFDLTITKPVLVYVGTPSP